MVDFHLELQNIKHINLKNIEYSFNEDIKKSIIIYNKAIAEIKGDNLDLAIEDLKTALSYNSGFAEAIKVLGLCYANKNDCRNAKKTFKKLAKYEMYSEVANKYIEDMVVEKNISKTLDVIKKAQDSCEGDKTKVKPSKKLKRISIMAIVFSVVFILGIVVIYKYSPTIQAYTSGNNNSNKSVDDNKEKDGSSDKNKSSETVSREEYKSIEKRLNDTQAELDNYKKKNDISSSMNEIQKYYNNGDYEKAAKGLIDIKDKNLDKEAKLKVDNMLSNIKEKHVWTIYNDGNKLYKEGKYSEALPKLKVASEVNPNLDIIPWATYQIGVCYKEGKDNTNALVFFKRVKEKYPKSEYVSYAQSMIDEIGHK